MRSLFSAGFYGLVALSLLSACAPEKSKAPKMAPAEFKVARAGTKITWKNLDTGKTVTTTVLPSDGFLVKRQANGKQYSRYGFFAKSPETISAIEKTKLETIWPLESGKTVSYERALDKERWTDTITITGTESVSVDAGKFDTYVVKWESRNAAGTWSGQCTRWYSPKLGWNVKTECSDTTSKSQRWEMTNVQ